MHNLYRFNIPLRPKDYAVEDHRENAGKGLSCVEGLHYVCHCPAFQQDMAVMSE